MLTTSDVVYLIVTDRFFDGDSSNNTSVDTSISRRHGGDLLGIIKKLPYLQELGVTTLWITPVYPNPSAAYHGYHSLDFESVDPALCSPELGPSGSRETIRRFRDVLHAHGMKLMLDLVVGHSAPEHPWVRDRPQWYNHSGSETPDKQWFYGLANLNHDLLDVNVYFLQNVLKWAGETKADAIRIDAARHVETTFWRYLKLYSQAVLPQTSFIAEFWDAQVHQVAALQNLHGFTGVFDFPLYEAIRDVFCKGGSMTCLLRPNLSDAESPGVLDMDPSYRNAYALVTFVGNHDTPRFFTAAGGDSDPDLAEARLRMALTFQMTSRGVPQLYYGDELAMAGGADPACRADMPWDWLAGAGDEAGARGRRTLEFTKQLIQLRRGSTALQLGLTVPLFVEHDVLIYARIAVEDIVVVALNCREKAVTIDVPLSGNGLLPSVARVGLADGLELRDMIHDRPTRINSGHLKLTLPPRMPSVLRGTPKLHTES